MKYAVMVAMAFWLVGCNSGSVAQSSNQVPETQVTVPEDPKVLELRRLKQLWDEPMETVINETYDYEVPIMVVEEEKGSYLGFIAFKKDRQIVSGWAASPPLDFIIDAIGYEEDRMIFTMRMVVVEEDEQTGEIRHRNPGVIEVIITKDVYLSNLEAYVSGKSSRRRLELVGTIIQAPGTVN
jgi:hypothetical protein